MSDLKNKRIINVSNRLPIKLDFSGEEVGYTNSDGGLATALSSVFKQGEHLWIGWPGAEVPGKLQPKVTRDISLLNLSPVYLSKQEINYFYEGFSNGTIWPLFHYFSSYSEYETEYWNYYVSVNKKYADEVLKYATTDDIIWIHDYQLMLVPEMIREALPDATIGYFHHIPFPSLEVYRALPWKKEIVKGLLGADTIGFQTPEDGRYFREAALKLSNSTTIDNKLQFNGRTIHVDAFPISIDYERFRQMAGEPETRKQEARLEKLVNTKLMISIDRLDYSKGILQRLQAYDMFLQRHPEYIQKITFVHLVVPSRDTVPQYQKLKHEMNKLISEINGRYATLGWQPIHNFYKSFAPNLLSALYKKADIALVTPLRDGMNLVSKEFVASNVNLNGVLVLSESAGAAHELKQAIQINPNDIDELSEAIFTALTMPDDEKRQRMIAMQQHIRATDVFEWAKKFINTLVAQQDRSTTNVGKSLSEIEIEEIEGAYVENDQRLILLDYDGTLVPIKSKPEEASPDKSLLQLLNILNSDPNNKVVVISGRDRHMLDKWLGHMPLDLIAEHGVFYKKKNKGWLSVPGLDNNWKADLKEILITYVNKAPGSFIEEKTTSLVWHYRNAKPETVEEQLPLLIDRLELAVKSKNLSIVKGKKVIEIKSSLVNKGKAVEALLSQNKYNFILAAGDDVTDEDMFKYLPKSAVTIKVGSNISSARLFVSSPQELRALLRKLSAVIKPNGQMLLAS